MALCAQCDQSINNNVPNERLIFWCKACYLKHRHLVAEVFSPVDDDALVEARGYTWWRSYIECEAQLLRRIKELSCPQCGKLHLQGETQ